MACNTCSSTPATTSYGSGCAPSTTGSLDAVMPRRVATPPVTPISFSWLASLRQTGSGQLVVRNCDEMGVLDSQLDGPVLFDSKTGTAYVGCTVNAEAVQDTFACNTDTLYGLPLYGADPGCRDFGQNPDRRLIVMRPASGSRGTLYAHKRVCSSTVGMRPEITPVEIDPIPVPSTPPDDLRYMAFRRVGAETDCIPATYEWYEAKGSLPVAADDLTDFTLPERDLVIGDDTDFGFAVWQLVNGKLVLQKLTNLSFQAFIEMIAVNTVKYLDAPGAALMDQQSKSTYNQTVTVDLTTHQHYSERAKEVQLQLFMNVSTGTQAYKTDITVNGVVKDFAVVDANRGNSNTTSEITVPIPASKKLVITVTKTVLAGGTEPADTPSRIQILLEKFA